MKRIILITSTLAVASLLSAAITVFDPTLVRTEMANAQRRLVEDLVRAQNQATQIAKAVEQINQLNEWLRRVGDLDEIDFEMIREAQRLLEQLLPSKTGFEIERDAQLEDLLVDHHVYGNPVTRDIYVDGKMVKPRPLEPYRSERVAQASFVHFHEVHQAGREKRKLIEAELRKLSQRLDRATTQAEVLKLQSTIDVQSALLASTNAEIQQAADASLVRFAQNQNEERIARKARAQEVRAREYEATAKIPQFYSPFSQPTYFTKGTHE